MRKHRGMYALLAVSVAQSAGCGFLFTTNVHKQPPAQIIVTGQQMGESEACRTVAHACTRHTAPVVRALDEVAGHYTRVHSLTAAQVAEAIRLAKTLAATRAGVRS